MTKTSKPAKKTSAKKPAAKKAAPKATPKPKIKAPKLDPRDVLLLATLPYVEEYGFSEQALLQGAEDEGIEAHKALALFPESIDLVKHFTDWADRAMLVRLKQDDLPDRVRDKVGLAVQRRLEVLEPYKAAERQALACFAKPWHATEALRCLYATVDTIWTYAGDTSTDYNFYTKRALLAGVYSTTVLRWLTDTSDNHQTTWDFLEHRIDHALKFGQLTSRLKSACSPLKAATDRLREKARRAA